MQALYLQNALGQRVIKVAISPAANNHIHFDQNGLMIAENAANDPTQNTDYVYLNGTLVAVLEADTTPAPADKDKDGVADSQDNCIDAANPNQTDTDGDGKGNACDLETLSLTSIGNEDGWLLESSENSNVGGQFSNTATALMVGDNKSDRQIKSLVSFDIPLAEGVVIESATVLLSRNATSVVNNPASLGTFVVDMKTGRFSNSPALEAADFEAPASEAAVATVMDGLTATAALSQAGIQSLTTALANGETHVQFRRAYERDDNDNNLQDYTAYFSGSATNEAKRPRLIFEYRLAD